MEKFRHTDIAPTCVERSKIELDRAMRWRLNKTNDDEPSLADFHQPPPSFRRGQPLTLAPTRQISQRAAALPAR